MTISLRNNFNIVRIFKLSMIFHFACTMCTLILGAYDIQKNFLTMMIDMVSVITLLIICTIVSIKSMKAFVDHHRYFMRHHQFTAVIVESFIAAMVFGLIFINKEIAHIFIISIINLSQKTHDHTFMFIMLLALIFYAMELYHALTLPYTSIQKDAIDKMVSVNIKTLCLKIVIFISSIIGFLHPIMNIITAEQIKQVDMMIIKNTTPDFFMIMRTIILILIGLWCSVGIYYVYKFYKKRR